MPFLHHFHIQKSSKYCRSQVISSRVSVTQHLLIPEFSVPNGGELANGPAQNLWRERVHASATKVSSTSLEHSTALSQAPSQLEQGPPQSLQWPAYVGRGECFDTPPLPEPRTPRRVRPARPHMSIEQHAVGRPIPTSFLIRGPQIRFGRPIW
jgi:hypothetical protein